VETITDLAADHSYEVKEGEGIVSCEKSRLRPAQELMLSRVKTSDGTDDCVYAKSLTTRITKVHEGIRSRR
jgi:hypothetical protein